MLILAVVSCKPEEFEPIGSKYNLITGVNGTWQIDHVEILDFSLPVPEGRDISDFYTQQASLLGLSFNSNGQTYQVLNPESPGNVFGQSGTYLFDDNEFPEEMWLVSGTDTIQLGLLNMVREIDPYMGLKFDRVQCDSKYAEYNYTFKRMK